MSDLVKFGGANMPATKDDLVAGLQNVTAHIGPSAGGTPFLRLGRDGIWVFGPESIEVEEGSLWAINPYSIQHGFAAWGDGELFGEAMVPFNQAPPNRSQLQDFGVEWKPQTSLMLQCIEGEDKGQTVLYKGTSIGMQNAVKELINQLINQVQTDVKNLVPVVELETDSYMHKQYGKTYTPILDIQHWVSMESGDAAESDPEDAPEAETAAESDAPEKKASDDAKPQRRRRGSTEASKSEGDKSGSTRRRRRRG